MTNKERMLHMVLDDTKLQELYDYDQSEYEDLYTALNSDNVVVASVARIIKELDGSTDESVQKRKCIKQYFLILMIICWYDNKEDRNRKFSKLLQVQCF